MNNSSQVPELDLSTIIRKRRKVLGVTQALLADLSGVGIHSISDIESRKGNPTIDITKKLLTALGLKLVVQIATSSPISKNSSSTPLSS